MAQTEESVRQERAARHLIGVRWAVIAVLFFLEAYLLRSFAIADAAWRPALYVLLAYILINILLRALIGSRPEQLSAGAASGIATIGLLSDIVLFALFSYLAPAEFKPLSFALYILAIIEAAILFSEGAVYLIFVLSLALFGYDAQRVVEGEVLIERLWGLLPQGFLLVLAVAFTAVSRRSTARHATELSHSRRLTETVVENLTDGILILDETPRILFINKAGEEILAVSAREVLGLRVRDRISVPIRNAVNLLKVVAANVAEHEQGDVQLEHPEERMLKVLSLPLRETDGRRIGRMIVFRDVTREAFFSKLKSDFISIAAHQLRTPLSSVKWAFSMLAEGSLGELMPDQKPVVAQGLETTDRLVRLVNSLLNVSRIEEGRFGYAFNSVDAASLITKVVETLRPKADSRGVRVAVSVPGNLAPLAADAEKIELVLENIVDNAVSYTQSGGEVRAEAAPEGKFLRFTVRDNGVGIPKEQQKLLYTKFFRGDNVIRMQTDGSGLGLYIAKNIVERHGGAISLTSEEGAGTMVSFTVPFA